MIRVNEPQAYTLSNEMFSELHESLSSIISSRLHDGNGKGLTYPLQIKFYFAGGTLNHIE